MGFYQVKFPLESAEFWTRRKIFNGQMRSVDVKQKRSSLGPLTKTALLKLMVINWNKSRNYLKNVNFLCIQIVEDDELCTGKFALQTDYIRYSSKFLQKKSSKKEVIKNFPWAA